MRSSAAGGLHVLSGGSRTRTYEEPLRRRRSDLADRVSRSEARDALERPHAVDPVDGGALRLPRDSGERLLHGGLCREAVALNGEGKGGRFGDAGVTR